MSEATEVRRRALDLLARREHGRAELARKLLRSASSEVVEQVLERLADQGLLSEERYLESAISSRTRRGQGPERICEILVQKGADRARVRAMLQAQPTDWDAQLHEVWHKKFRHAPLDAGDYARQARFLVYRGFPLGQVHAFLRAVERDQSRLSEPI